MRKKKQNIKAVQQKHFDRRLVTLTMVLLVVGAISIADASSASAMRTFSDPYYFLKQHILWMGIGMVGLILGATIPVSFWKKYSSHLFIGNLALLFLVLIPGVGTKVYGARRWINLFGFGFQPSEVAKLTTSFYFAKLASKKFPFNHYLVVLGILVGLIMLQPDLGTTLVVVGLGAAQLLVAGFPIIYFALFGLVGGGLGSLFIMFSDYRRRRLQAFFATGVDNLESSYHIKQILIALGSGGLFGVGIGQSRQKHLFLPETATDSVFAVIAEEVGFVGSAIIIIILLMFVVSCFRIALKAEGDYAKILAVGISSWFGLQILLNLSSIVVLTPLTGIPLPFFSYGGTSLISILLATGILLNISKNE